VFESPDPGLIRVMLELKRDVASLRRVVLPQRDVVGRLARREFPEISEAIAYRFRDVYDHLVRLTDEALYFQDRISGLLEANLSNVSNRLNQVMKVLTLIATVFMPMTVLTGIWGMNVDLPQLPGGHAAQFWWIMGMLVGITVWMVWLFRTRRWF
jgi:magnesium transporter